MARRSPRTLPPALALALVSLLLLAAGAHGSRFQFSLTSRTEECFLEEVNARASDNKLLFRFGILEPKAYDLLDVQVRR